MVQLPDHLQGIVLPHRPRVVYRLIPHLLDHPRLLEHRLGQQVLKARLMQQRPQAVVIGHGQGRIMAVEPVHQRLQAEAAVKAGGAGVAVDVAFRQDGRFGDGAERVGQEREV
jgi:hypothetical protein